MTITAKNEAMATAQRASTKRLEQGDARVAQPLFTLRETAGYLGIPTSTVHSWARPADAEPLITVFPRHGNEATVPFIGFAEAFVLVAFRRAGVPLQRIRPAVQALEREIGVDHALASKRLYTDGAEVLFDFADGTDEDLLELVVVRTGQRQFTELVRQYLERITYGQDGWAAKLVLPTYERARVVVDPRIGFGLPLVENGGARVEDLVDRFRAGDGVAEIAADFAVEPADVEDVIRGATRLAA